MKKIAYTHSSQASNAASIRRDEWLGYASVAALCDVALKSIFDEPLIDRGEHDSNCHNCGAPADEAVCAYCGTRHE